MEAIVIQDKNKLLQYKGQPVNSHIFSQEQNFLLKCRSGLKLKELSIEQFIDLVFNKIVTYAGAKFITQKDREDSAIELIEMLLKNYPEKYANEVVGSYFLADKKRLLEEDGNVIQLFRMVDYRQCSDLLHAFERYFKKQFETEMKSQKFWYGEEEKTKETKDQIRERFLKSFKQALEVVKSGQRYNVAGTDLFLFSELKNDKIISISEEEAELQIEKATNQYKNSLKSELSFGNISFGRKVEIRNMIDLILPTDVKVKNIARTNILNEVLVKIVNKEIELPYDCI